MTPYATPYCRLGESFRALVVQTANVTRAAAHIDAATARSSHGPVEWRLPPAEV